ncbi:MAG: hypothetical protein N3A57_04485, partial [Negativicutes bacterium]|nr:hypothetical protein [Negativicutes bacterium]
MGGATAGRCWDDFWTGYVFLWRWLLFVMAALLAGRLVFLVSFQADLATATGRHDLVRALFTGWQLSLKTCWWLTVLPAVLASLPRLFAPRWPTARIYLVYGWLVVAVLSLTLSVRLPFYQQFRISFSPLLFTVAYEDWAAVWTTLRESYGLFWRLTVAAAMVALAGWLWRRLVGRPVGRWPLYGAPRVWDWLGRVAIIGLTMVFGFWSYHGGAWHYGQEMVWENAGVTADRLLNEAVLDDFQALWRAWQLDERIRSCDGIDVSPEAMRHYGRIIAGRDDIDSANWDDYTLRHASGNRLVPPPRQIFLIVAESFAAWPFLPEYDRLGIVSASKRLASRPDTVMVLDFLPNGMSTIGAVTGIVSGLADANLYMNYLPESYRQPYATAIAPALEGLGYRCSFWYGGP